MTYTLILRDTNQGKRARRGKEWRRVEIIITLKPNSLRAFLKVWGMVANTERSPQSHSLPSLSLSLPQTASQIKQMPWRPQYPTNLEHVLLFFMLKFIYSKHSPSCCSTCSISYEALSCLLLWLKLAQAICKLVISLTESRSQVGFWVPWFNDKSMPSRASFRLPTLQPQFVSSVQRLPVWMNEKWLPIATREIHFQVHAQGETRMPSKPWNIRLPFSLKWPIQNTLSTQNQ